MKIGERKILEGSPEWYLIHDEVLAAEAALPQPQVPMGPYRATDRCPKCRTTCGTTEYHPGAHTGCPIFAASGFRFWLSPSPWRPSKTTAEWRDDAQLRADAKWAALRASIPEHFDRVCPNCKHSWVEGLPVPEEAP